MHSLSSPWTPYHFPSLTQSSKLWKAEEPLVFFKILSCKLMMMYIYVNSSQFQEDHCHSEEFSICCRLAKSHGLQDTNLHAFLGWKEVLEALHLVELISHPVFFFFNQGGDTQLPNFTSPLIPVQTSYPLTHL